MNIIDSLEFRYVKVTDDLEAIGRILFHTDPFIYPAFLGNEENAAKVMSRAIREDCYCFSPNNIYAAFYEDKPVAIICKNPDGAYKWNCDEWKRMICCAGTNIPNTFEDVAKNYFLPLNKECMLGYIYILAVCVSYDMRKQGVGTELLKRFLAMHSHNKILLDTLSNNEAGILLYKKAGFLEQEYYWGYSLSEPYPRCVRMIKENE